MSRGGLKTPASICQFDHHLRLLAARKMIGAQAEYPVLTCRPNGVNILSYSFPRSRREVGSAIQYNLKPANVPCSWTKSINLVTESCSYSSRDIRSREDPLAVESEDVKLSFEPGDLQLIPLALKLEL
jgi:hypothetical protein